MHQLGKGVNGIIWSKRIRWLIRVYLIIWLQVGQTEVGENVSFPKDPKDPLNNLGFSSWIQVGRGLKLDRWVEVRVKSVNIGDRQKWAATKLVAIKSYKWMSYIPTFLVKTYKQPPILLHLMVAMMIKCYKWKSLMYNKYKYWPFIQIANQDIMCLFLSSFMTFWIMFFFFR